MSTQSSSTSSPPSASWSSSAPRRWSRAGKHAARRAPSPGSIAGAASRPASTSSCAGRTSPGAVGRRQMKYGTQHVRAGRSWCSGILGGRQLPRRPPPEALGPHQGPALQPLRPDPEGRGRPQGRREDHLLPAPARHGARPGPSQGVPGALARGSRSSSWTPCRARPRPRPTTCGAPGPSSSSSRATKREKSHRTTASRTSRTPSSRSPARARRRSASPRARASATSTTAATAASRASRRALGKSQYETKKVFLLREKKVPADCTVLVVAGPEKDLLPEAIDAIRDYVKGGGKALRHGRARAKDVYPNLDALLKEWNIEAAQGHRGGRLGDGPALRHRASSRPSRSSTPTTRSPRTSALATAFHTARSVAGGQGHDRGRLRPEPRRDLARSRGRRRTSPSRADRVRRGQGPTGPDLARRRWPRSAARPAPSPPRLAGAVARSPKTPKAPEGRVVAVGDATSRATRSSASRATRTSS